MLKRFVIAVAAIVATAAVVGSAYAQTRTCTSTRVGNTVYTNCY